jgi:hypothetical protein
MADGNIGVRVGAAVDAWLAWLPKWAPSSARSAGRVCRKCLGSPVVAAANLGEAPHKVQHTLVSRIHAIVDDEVERYTAAELPLLHSELLRSEAQKKAARPYRPEEGLDHEFEGFGVDPEPVPGEPYLFTLTGLAEQEAREVAAVAPPASVDRDRLRLEIALSDDRAAAVGRAACLALVDHRARIAEGMALVVAPQLDAMMAELDLGLLPPDFRAP